MPWEGSCPLPKAKCRHSLGIDGSLRKPWWWGQNQIYQTLPVVQLQPELDIRHRYPNPGSSNIPSRQQASLYPLTSPSNVRDGPGPRTHGLNHFRTCSNSAWIMTSIYNFHNHCLIYKIFSTSCDVGGIMIPSLQTRGKRPREVKDWRQQSQNSTQPCRVGQPPSHDHRASLIVFCFSQNPAQGSWSVSISCTAGKHKSPWRPQQGVFSCVRACGRDAGRGCSPACRHGQPPGRVTPAAELPSWRDGGKGNWTTVL